MAEATHFDRRGPDYDEDEVHQRIVSLLVAGAQLRPGFHVLDIATGTGLAALKAAQRLGPAGRVTGIDASPGMLTQAHRKADEAGLRNVEFAQADANRLDFPRESFDCIFCASAIVLMSDIPSALRHWSQFLKPHGCIAFDTPGKPFGISEKVADIAAEHGVRLTYADIADTPAKCRSLLNASWLEPVAIRTELVNSKSIEISKALAFWDDRSDHPAWRALKQASQQTREAIHAKYVDSIMAAAIDGYVPNYIALNFAYGRRLGL